MEKCKFYDKHLYTIKSYMSCLYEIEGCSCGGLLHVMIDDENIDDSSVLFTLKECLSHPEREESRIGILICEEFLKLSIEQRRLLVDPVMHDFMCVYGCNKACDKCPVTTDGSWV